MAGCDALVVLPTSSGLATSTTASAGVNLRLAQTLRRKDDADSPRYALIVLCGVIHVSSIGPDTATCLLAFPPRHTRTVCACIDHHGLDS